MKNATFGVPIINDRVLEDNENFSLIINSSSLPSYVIVGDHAQAGVTIVDDESKLVILLVKLLCMRMLTIIVSNMLLNFVTTYLLALLLSGW